MLVGSSEVAAPLEDTSGRMEDVRDEVGNLNFEVAGSEVESEEVGSIATFGDVVASVMLVLMC